MKKPQAHEAPEKVAALLSPVTAEAKAFLAQMKDSPLVFKYFAICLECPRPSGHTEIIRKRVVEIAKALGHPADVDEAGNILIRKPASKGMEKKPGVCLQAHLDMVCQATTAYPEFVPEKSPIRPVIHPDGYLRADRTSLGGDDGAGIAICLAVLEDKTLVHGPLELLFTVDEEVGLVGANKIKAGWLKSRYFINIDSEEEDSLCVGCAGGVTTVFHAPVERVKPADGVHAAYVQIALDGFRGGHTGVDVAENRANPLKLLLRIYCALEAAGACDQAGESLTIVSIEGGTVKNAIPRSATSVICLSSPTRSAADLYALAETVISRTFALLVKEFPGENQQGCTAVVKQLAEVPYPPANAETSARLRDLLTLLPFGPLRWSPDVHGLVETSYSMTVVHTSPQDFIVLGSGRSSRDSQIDSIHLYLNSVVRSLGLPKYLISGAYPGWTPKMDSPLLKMVVEAFKEVHSKAPKVEVIHAGLECGVLQAKHPGLDCISLGPEIHHPHSPDEEMLLSSVAHCYAVVRSSLAKLASLQEFQYK